MSTRPRAAVRASSPDLPCQIISVQAQLTGVGVVCKKVPQVVRPQRESPTYKTKTKPSPALPSVANAFQPCQAFIAGELRDVSHSDKLHVTVKFMNLENFMV